jgi:hypothetical protein
MAALLCGAAANATDLVMFEDGRGLRVSGFELAQGLATLTLEDGGELRVPMNSIVAIERAIDAEDPVPPEDPNGAVEAAAIVNELRVNENWRRAAGRYADAIAAAADRNRLDRALLAAVAKVESNFNPYAISPADAGDGETVRRQECLRGGSEHRRGGSLSEMAPRPIQRPRRPCARRLQRGGGSGRSP